MIKEVVLHLGDGRTVHATRVLRAAIHVEKDIEPGDIDVVIDSSDPLAKRRFHYVPAEIGRPEEPEN